MKYRFSTAIAVALIVSIVVSNALAQEAVFGKNKVHYRMFNWSYLQTDHFDIYYYTGGYDLAAWAANALESAYVEIRASLNYDLRRRVPVIIYQSHNDFQQTNVTTELIDEGIGGFTESFKNRVVLPFLGSYEEFRHVLHHELTHAMIFDLLYGNVLGSLLSRQYLFQVPLWFAEGFAEYSSRHGWDTFADMVMRDATIHNYLVSLDYVGGYLAYKEGQSALLYLADRYGEEKIPEILNKGKTHLSMDKAMKMATGLSVKDFSEEWMKALKREYWPEIARRQEPKEFARQLTNHDKDGSHFNEKPAFSPQGDRLAIFSDKSEYTAVYIISAVDGKVLERVVQGERSGDFEQLHSYVSGLTWSPDASRIALIAKSKGTDALMIVRTKDHKVEKRLKFHLDGMLSPAWSPDGNRVAFVGVKNGRSDLYLYDFTARKLTPLTNDHFADQEPAWRPDGEAIAFASDRPIDRESVTSSPDKGVASQTDAQSLSNGSRSESTQKFGDYNLFLMNLTSGLITGLTSDGKNNRAPSWSPDGSKLVFTNNQNGIDNLYILELNSLTSYPISNVLTGCFNPSWSKQGDKIAFSSFYKGGFDIFVMKDIKPVIPERAPLPLTAYAERLAAGEKTFFARGEDGATTVVSAVQDTLTADSRGQKDQSRGSDTTRMEDEGVNKGEGHSYIFRVGGSEEDTVASAPDTLSVEPLAKIAPDQSKNPDGTFREHKYKAKFAPDIIYGTVGYSTFYGLQGQSYILISDIFGDHQFFIATDLINSIDQSNIQVLYFYGPRRVDYGVGALHTKYYYLDPYGRLFSDRVYGFLSLVALPFTKFTRLDLYFSGLNFDRRYYDPNPFTGQYDDASAQVALFNLTWINDNALWGLTGPQNGRRAFISVEGAPRLANKSISYVAAEFDWRRYYRFARRYTMTLRIAGGTSTGNQPKQFFIGGTTNWLGGRIATANLNNVYGVRDLYLSSVVTPLRGYDFYALQGTHYGLLNLELRYPFVDYLSMRFPLPITISQVQGVLFYDMGAAWTDNSTFQGTASNSGLGRLKDIRAGFGFGARANLGFLILRFDTAWRTDLASVARSPRYYFSLGANF